MPTVKIRTVGATARQYSTIASAEADIATIAGSANLITEDVQVVFDLYNDADFAERVTFDGITTDATRNVIYRAAVGERHNGYQLDTGVHVEPTSGSGHIFTVSDDHIHFEYLEVQQYSGSATSNECFRITSGVVGLQVEWCQVDTLNTSDTQGDGFYAGDYSVGSTSYPIIIRDCKITNFGRAGVHMQSFNNVTDQYWTLVNNTVSACDYGFGYRVEDVSSTLNLVMVNNLIGDVGTSSYNITGTPNNGTVTPTGSAKNMSEGGSAMPGTGSVVCNFTESDPGGPGTFAWFNDYTPTPADMRLVDGANNDAIDFGNGPSVESLVNSTDIAGNARSGATCEPGCLELVAPGLGMIFRRRRKCNVAYINA